MPIPHNLPPHPTFHDADFKADFYDNTGKTIIARNVPMKRMKDVEVIIHREDGIPYPTAAFGGLIPLTRGIGGANQVAVTDIIQKSVAEYDLVEIDDDPRRWIMFVALNRRYLPIGQR